MKKIALSIVLGLLVYTGFAQTNPTVTGAYVSPDPIPGATPYATIGFIFANLGNDPISNLDVDGFSDPIVLKVSLQGGTYDDVNFPDPLSAIGGSFASHFTWTYDAATKTYTGSQNQPITGFDGGDITFGYKATVASPNTAPANGFAVNLTSNSNAPNGPGTNDTNDDDTRAKTYILGPLPVTLTAFSVAKEGSTAYLTWTTTEETNSDRFEIEHSISGKDWNKIGTVDSHGDSKVKNVYNFTDANPVNGGPSHGENLYRLKMVDRDATYAYSRIQSVKFDGNGADLSVYPNPVTDQLFVRDFAQVSGVTITDLNGRTVHQSGATETGMINVQNLRTGIYIVRISRSNGVTSSQKIVVGK